MEFKGTKGKWRSCCIKTTPHYIFTAEGETTICGFYKKQDMRDDLSDEELRANALLISKAPEMLEMLKESIETIISLKVYHNDIGNGNDYVEKAEQLIKEATEL